LIITDEDYLKYLPFLSSSNVMKQVNITIDKIENTNTFNDILFDIYREINFLITNEIRIFPLENSFYEISKFYLTILLLKGIDNIAITRIWVKYFMKKIEVNMKAILTERKIRERKIDLFLDVFRLLEANEQFKLKRITIEGNIAFGIHMMKYLDIEDSLMDEVTTLHKGHVIIPTEETEFLIKLIQDFAQKKIFKLYEKAELDLTITKKIKFTTDKIKEDVINSQKVSINTKKHFVPKELLEEQERIQQAEQASIIIKELDDNKINVKNFAPCINVLLDKIYNKKIQLSHNENLLLVSYLNKKNFPLENIIKIFSKAVNYNSSTTKYQVEFAVKKGMMPSSCQNLRTEGLCYADDICKKYKIKNPLVYKND
jgi:hypothetical protein